METKVDHIATIHTPQFEEPDGWLQCGNEVEFRISKTDWNLNELRMKPDLVRRNLESTIVYTRQIGKPETEYEFGRLCLRKEDNGIKHKLSNKHSTVLILDVRIPSIVLPIYKSLYEQYRKRDFSIEFPYKLLKALESTYVFLDYERAEIKRNEE